MSYTNYGDASIVQVKHGITYLWANGNTKYLAKHTDISAPKTVASWEIWKYSTSGEEWEGPRHGRADSEALINALAWSF